MKRLGGLVSVVGALAVAGTFAGTAFGSKVTFNAKYAGHVTEKVDGQTVVASPSGKGKGTLIGTSRLTGKVTGTTANPPCTPLNGPGTLSGAKGKLKLTLLSNSQACAASQEQQNNISFHGSAKVTGGTGKFRGWKGTLRYTGHYDRASGEFNVRLFGSLKH